jgi:hypothetical protein
LVGIKVVLSDREKHVAELLRAGSSATNGSPLRRYAVRIS